MDSSKKNNGSGGGVDIASFSQKFKQVMNLTHHHYSGDGLALMQQHWLTFPQVVTMHILQKDGPQTISDIAARINLSKAATSHLVDKLVGKKLVERTESEEDRRCKSVSISRKGKALISRIDQSRNDQLTALIERLSPELRKKFLDVLDQVILELGGVDAQAGSCRFNLSPKLKK
jgi:DNA-binding MarR family transcriptional regulator